MDTQDQVVTTQSQAKMEQVNREVGPCVNQNASNMASHLSHFTRMNPPMFFGSKVNKNPQDFLDEVYKICFSMEVTSNQMEELAAHQLKEVP